MERIKLIKEEKKVLRLLSKHGVQSLDTIPRSQVRRALRSLEEKHLIRAAWMEGGDYEAVRLTRNGSDYLVENPSLINPIDWKWWIGTAIGVATLTVAIIALCIAFSIYNLKILNYLC